MTTQLDKFIAREVTGRPESLFEADLRRSEALLQERIGGKRVCVIGGAGSIGSAFIKEALRYGPASLLVVDLSENGLAELTRDLRSTEGLSVPADFRTYALDFADPLFARLFRDEGGFDIVANFSAHKHVRSEKDRYAVQALLQNNLIKARGLLDLLSECPPERFFCVSTDKAAGPVNIMGASKRVMEDLIMAYRDRFPVTTARFANVAFSNGSLPDSWLHRLQKRQPLVAPDDVLRYFVSPEEAGQICLLACILGRSGEIFYPKLRSEQMRSFSDLCDRFLASQGLRAHPYESEAQARAAAAGMAPDCLDYPVYYAPSDTTGEKPYEEFYLPSETVDESRFGSLGVITASERKSKAEVDAFLDLLSLRMSDPACTKECLVEALSEFLPQFHHEEKGRNLDQKM